MALFCQVFELTHVFRVNEWREMYEASPKTGDRIRYYVKDWIANDGSLKTTLKYNCDAGGDAPGMRRRGFVENAYNTVVKDYHINLMNNSVGYVPTDSPKRLTKEYVVYDKSGDKVCYEDRGFKHLYESHHDCYKKKYCEGFCLDRMSRAKTSYKRCDYYQVENEEMSCSTVRVDYGMLDKFLNERSSLDKDSKDMLFNTMIPPPVGEELDANVRKVYVTELEKDLSCGFILPSTVQDPCWVDYDEAVVKVKLVEKPRRERKDEISNNGPMLVNQLGIQCGMLRCLDDYMSNFGTDVQSEFMNLKIMLNHHYKEDKEFVANFILSTTVAVLRSVMFQLTKMWRTVGLERMDREEPIRPMFSPCCVHLLSALNVLQWSCRTGVSLCDVTLMTERSGSLLESVLEERNNLLKRCYDKCRLMRDERGAPTDQGRYTFNPQAVAYQMREAGGENASGHCGRINAFQSHLYVFQVLVDVYKYLSIDVHHWLGRVCPTCHPAHLMKQELQTMIESVHEALPLIGRNLTFDKTNTDPVNVENVQNGDNVKFMKEEREFSDDHLEAEFRRHSEIHKLATDCDLVARGLRVSGGHHKDLYTQAVRSSNFQMNNRLQSMEDFVDHSSSVHRRQNLKSLEIRETLEESLNNDLPWSHVKALKDEDDHYTPSLGYYPFKLSYWTDSECCKIASTFTSIRDDVRYQGCDRSGTYEKDVSTLTARQRAQDRTDRMNRCHPLLENVNRRRVVRRGVTRRLDFEDGEDDEEETVWREQFDSIRRDFNSATKRTSIDLRG